MLPISFKSSHSVRLQCGKWSHKERLKNSSKGFVWSVDVLFAFTVKTQGWEEENRRMDKLDLSLLLEHLETQESLWTTAPLLDWESKRSWVFSKQPFSCYYYQIFALKSGSWIESHKFLADIGFDKNLNSAPYFSFHKNIMSFKLSHNLNALKEVMLSSSACHTLLHWVLETNVWKRNHE